MAIFQRLSTSTPLWLLHFLTVCLPLHQIKMGGDNWAGQAQSRTGPSRGNWRACGHQCLGQTVGLASWNKSGRVIRHKVWQVSTEKLLEGDFGRDRYLSKEGTVLAWRALADHSFTQSFNHLLNVY